MELREAIEKLTMWHKANPRTGPLGVVMNAVADGTMIPAEQCFSVKEGYEVDAYHWNGSDPNDCPLSEALTIRSVEDVRREGYELGYKDGFKKSGWEEMQRQTALIDTPQPDELRQASALAWFEGRNSKRWDENPYAVPDEGEAWYPGIECDHGYDACPICDGPSKKVDEK